jgi:hypothetical protein
MSKRKEHMFQFTGAKIAGAAAEEAIYHAKRATWWNDEYEKAAVEAKAKGVEVKHYAVTGGTRAQVVFDPTLQGRLDETYSKRAQHQRESDQFKIEAAAYGTQADRVYELDTEDVMHFRLAGGERDP